jgi:hypothetical protein
MMNEEKQIRVVDVIGLLLLPIVIMIVRIGLDWCNPWTRFATDVLNWLCSTLAFSCLVIALLCIFTGKRVADVPAHVVRRILFLIVLLGLTAVGGAGFVNGHQPSDIVLSLAEWLGFCIVLFAVLAACRLPMRKRQTETDTQPPPGN